MEGAPRVRGARAQYILEMSGFGKNRLIFKDLRTEGGKSSCPREGSLKGIGLGCKGLSSQARGNLTAGTAYKAAKPLKRRNTTTSGFCEDSEHFWAGLGWGTPTTTPLQMDRPHSQTCFVIHRNTCDTAPCHLYSVHNSSRGPSRTVWQRHSPLPQRRCPRAQRVVLSQK